MKVTRENVINASRIYAAQTSTAVQVYEVVLAPEARELLRATDPGSEPRFLTLVEGATLNKMFRQVRTLLPEGTSFVQIYRATPPQWN